MVTRPAGAAMELDLADAMLTSGAHLLLHRGTRTLAMAFMEARGA